MESPSKSKSKPKILVLSPSPAFLMYEPQFSDHFHMIKAYESPLPLPQFLSSIGIDPKSITAMLTSGASSITADTVLCHLPCLGCVVTSSAGTNHIDLADCRRHGIAVANAAHVYSDDCADVAVSLLMNVLRKVSAADQFVRAGHWNTKGDFPLGRRLGGKRVGIVGLGSIGSRVATRLEAFNCHVSYTSRKQKQSVSYPYYSNVLELAANNDVLVVCCALTDKTRHIINKQVLSASGKEGIIINIARGPVIDEKELVRFLVEGKIAGAGLDVFENEPAVPEELFSLDNVVLSPHQAFSTPESFWDMYEHVVANFQAFFSNKPLLSPVEYN